MTNEEIVMKIKNGEDNYINDLWLNVEKFITARAKMFYNNNESRCRHIGVEIEDLVQVGFFALMSAIEAFKNDYKFLTYLSYHLKNQFRSVCKMRYIGWQNNPVYQSVSLDDKICDDSETTFGDMLTDASDIVEDIVIKDRQEHLEKDIKIAFSALTDRQIEVINGLYYEGLTFQKLADRLSVQKASITNIKKCALKRLKAQPTLQAYMLV